MTGETEMLFVYGTLRRGSAHPNAAMLAGQARFVASATIGGRLHRVSWYPALILSGDPGERVIGDVFALDDPVPLLAALDAFEGCAPDNPHPQEYRRARLAVDAGGQALTPWVYVYNWPVKGLKLIPGGDFLGRQDLGGSGIKPEVRRT